MPNKYKDGTKGILVRLQEAEKLRVDLAAKRAGLTTSDFIRQAIFDRVRVVEQLTGSQAGENK